MILFALLLFVTAVLLLAVVDGYETGIVSANPIRVRYLAEDEGSRRARLVLRFLERQDTLLTVLVLGANVLTLMATLIVSRLVELALPGHFLGLTDVVTTLVLAPFLLLLGEIVPKSIFRTHPTELAVAFAPFIRLLYVAAWPVAAPIALITRTVFRSRSDEHLTTLMGSLEGVRVLVDEGADSGTIEPEEQEMIHSVIDLQTSTARDIMVPRIAIEALADTTTRSELVRMFERTGRTRIPIYHETIDSVVGVVNAYNVLVDEEPEREDIARFVKEIQHVPDSIKVIDLLRVLRSSKQHMAVVTDEYGGTDGLVTIEDILEEIFGEIQDETDHEESRITKVGPNAYVVDARLSLEEMAELVDLQLEDASVKTVGGWVMRAAGRIPAQGQVILHGRVAITVLAAGPNNIGRVRLEVLPEPVENRDGIGRKSR